jgi:hypothetical protein
MKILLVLGSLLFTHFCCAQQNTIKVRKNIEYFDTIPYFSGNFKDGKGVLKKYQINNEKVSKETYDKYYTMWSNINICRPCWLQGFVAGDSTDLLVFEGFFYTDCAIGPYRAYYSNGNMSVNGQFANYEGRKEVDENGNWRDLSVYCRKIGKWEYFDERGKLVKTEYFDGKGQLVSNR